MDKIMDLMNNLGNLEKFVPKLDTLMGWVQWLISLSVRVGPVCILVLGLIYLFIPPKEANRVAGYRTYFGMGSVDAWMFTQRVSGAIMTVTGLILFLIARSAVKDFDGMDLMDMAQKAFSLIKVQVICALVIYIFMFLLTAVMFNRKGYRRFGKNNRKPSKKAAKTPAVKKIPQEEAPNEVIAEEVPQVEYERQGEQVITADDIVIEGLD